MNIDVLSDFKAKVADIYRVTDFTASSNDIIFNILIDFANTTISACGFQTSYSANRYAHLNEPKEFMHKIIHRMKYNVSEEKITKICNNILLEDTFSANNRIYVRIILLWNGLNMGTTTEIKIVYEVIIIIIEYYDYSVSCRYLYANCKNEEARPSYCAISTINVHKIILAKASTFKEE